MSGLRLSRVGLVVGGTVVAIAAGWLIAFTTLTAPALPSVGRSTAPAQVPVVLQTYEDPISVQVLVRREPDAVLRSPVAGLVSESMCRAGDDFVTGGSLFAVDGTPLANIGSGQPLWRDLVPGATGDDVDDIKALLAARGLPTDDGEALGWTDIESARQFVGDIGGPRDFREIGPRLFLWAPTSPAPISGCLAAAGQPVGAGEPLATARGNLSASLSGIRDDTLPGPRVMRVDGIEVPVTAEHVLAPDTDLSVLTATSSYRAAIAEADPAGLAEISLPAVASLVSPTEVASLPPSAVRAEADGRGCVSFEGLVHEVRIVGSELGRSLVAFTSAPAPEHLDTLAPATCG